MRPLSSRQLKAITWAWVDDGEGRIPAGALTMAAGREGTGKSSFGIWLCGHVTRGTLPGAWFGTPRNVIYVALEDDYDDTIGPRMVATGADRSRVYEFAIRRPDRLDEDIPILPVDIPLLEQAVRDYDVALVVLDPLISLISGKIDTHREAETRRALEPLRRMAARTRAVVLGIGHFSKAQHADVSALITGSGAFKNVPRAIFGFAVDKSTCERVITQTKNSGGRDDLPSLAYRIEPVTVETATGPTSTGRLVMLGPSERSVGDILASGDPHEAEERRDAAAWLYAYLLDNGGEAYARDVFKAGKKDGFSEDALQRARLRIKASTGKDGMAGGWMWRLKDTPPAAADHSATRRRSREGRAF